MERLEDLVEKKNFEKALDAIDYLLKCEPDKIGFWLVKASLAAHKGDNDLAESCVETFREVTQDSNDPILIKLREKACTYSGDNFVPQIISKHNAIPINPTCRSE